MEALPVALSIFAFSASFSVLGIPEVAREAMKGIRGAGRVVRDRDLSDEEKERRIRRATLDAGRAVLAIGGLSLIALLIAALPLYLFDWAGVVPLEKATAFMLRWDVIAAASVAAIGIMVFLSRRKTARNESDYNALDRLLHGLAFASPAVQRTLAEMEDSMYSDRLVKVADRPPVFIASLPRAGTTVLLNALSELPGFATQTYRDMPFVMAPLLWSRLSTRFRREKELTERAHGDGLKVGLDSPEAFEDVLWRNCWPGHYEGGTITPWTEADDGLETREALRRYFRKLVLLRAGGEGRYISKNNNNIARLPLLRHMFPESRILVPVRDPLEHAASLLRQHRNFLARHESDSFARNYMRDVGHYEFGAVHKPIGFDGFAEASKGLSPEVPDYWLTYWIAAYRHVLARADDILLIPQEALTCGRPDALAAVLSYIEAPGKAGTLMHHFRPVEPRADPSEFDPELVATSRAIHGKLIALAEESGTGPGARWGVCSGT